MGIGVSVEVPSLGRHDYRLDFSSQALWMESEYPFGKESDRCIATVFAHDMPRILIRVLRCMNDGIVVTVDGADRRICLSIDGSLSSAIGSAFILAFVLRPVSIDGVDVPLEEITRSLKRRLEDAIDHDAEAKGGCNSAYVDVRRFEAVQDSLFSNLAFSEYRLGVDCALLQARPGVLGDIGRRLAHELGQHGVPIAYMYFPDLWQEFRDDLRWLRVGIGVPAESIASLDVDLAVNDIAESSSCVYAKYDRRLDEPFMGRRFTVIGDYRSVEADRGVIANDDVTDEVDILFLEDVARPGLVADVLAKATHVLGGSMTVLGGHTVSCWLLPRSGGISAMEDLRKVIDLSTGTVECSPIVAPVSLAGREGLDQGSERFWLAWRCGDSPGVLYRLMNRLYEWIDAECHSPGRVLSVRYAISRVLADGESCAGKVKLALSAEIMREVDARRSELEEVLISELRGDIDHWRPRKDWWKHRPVRVERAEPGEEPWASLLVQR